MRIGNGYVNYTLNVMPVGGVDEIEVTLSVRRGDAPLTLDQIAELQPVIEAIEYYTGVISGEIEVEE